ncbi:hypothetical protein MRB53_038216 [Persea americana]|nr:hypothetical protein MRB53_038216 [Persea americana]
MTMAQSFGTDGELDSMSRSGSRRIRSCCIYASSCCSSHADTLCFGNVALMTIANTFGTFRRDTFSSLSST